MEKVLARLKRELRDCDDGKPLWQAIVDAPFSHKFETGRLHLGIIVLCFADNKGREIHRIALSNTEPAAGTKKMSVKRFEEIKVPLDDTENIIALSIRDAEPRMTTDWKYLFTPALTEEEARFNQAGGGIGCSYVYPLKGLDEGGALIFSYFQYPDKIGEVQKQFMQDYSRIVAERLSAANAQV
jgi:hypothetical protein